MRVIIIGLKVAKVCEKLRKDTHLYQHNKSEYFCVQCKLSRLLFSYLFRIFVKKNKPRHYENYFFS